MNPVIRKSWADACRSGYYKLGSGALRYEKDGELVYCPVGILCDLYSKDTDWTEDAAEYDEEDRRESKWTRHLGCTDPTEVIYEIHTSVAMMPSLVMEWCDFWGEELYRRLERLEKQADTGDYTLDELADRIEAWF